MNFDLVYDSVIEFWWSYFLFICVIQMWHLSVFFVFFAILRNNLRTERNIWTQIWFLRIMIHIILCSDRRKYAYRLEPDGYRIENFGEKMKNFEIWWIMPVFRKIENVFEKKKEINYTNKNDKLVIIYECLNIIF